MDRPKHRRFIFLGIALLLAEHCCCSDAMDVSARTVFTGRRGGSQLSETARRADSRPRAEPPPLAEATATCSTERDGSRTGGTLPRTRYRRSDTPARGGVRDHARRRAGQGDIVGDEPRVAKTFKSTDGRFAWRQAPVGNWKPGRCRPRYQHFHVENLGIAAGKTTREIVMPLQRGHTLEGRVFEQSLWRRHWRRVGQFSRPRNAAKPVGVRCESATRRPRSDGTFVLDGVPSGDMIVTAGANNHARARSP